MISESYMNKENRDKRAKELRAQGYKVRRSSYRNQQIHPQYNKDYPREISDDEKGFGNTMYKTHFAVVYCLDAE